MTDRSGDDPVDDSAGAEPRRPDPAATTGETEPAAGAEPETTPEDPEAARARRLVRSIVEWIAVVVGALAVALVLRAVLFQAYWIPSESMEPTLQRDDRVLVNRLSYRLHDVNRGDVVVFERPPGEPDGGIKDLIKRVIALEGETIAARNGQITIDDQPLVEDYTADGPPIADFGPIEVPEDHVFVMGDNRNNSVDSRVFQPIDEGAIVGRAFVLFWPLDRVGGL